MNALIILAHGSRRQESNLEVFNLTKKVAALSQGQYENVSHAFLELATPTLNEAIDELVNKGSTFITIMPYFLNSGNHVIQDIPELIETAQQKHPECQFKTSPCIGMHDDMPALILKQSKLE